MQHAIFIAVAFLTAVFVQLANMNRLNRKFIANEQYFNKRKYWTAEKFSILGTMTFIIIFCLAFPDAVIQYEINRLLQFVCYALAGGVGNTIFSYFLGRSEQKLKRMIDEKTANDKPYSAPNDEELNNG